MIVVTHKHLSVILCQRQQHNSHLPPQPQIQSRVPILHFEKNDGLMGAQGCCGLKA